MKQISKPNALKIFYCLSAADGVIEEKEITRLQEIAAEFYGDVYADPLQAVRDECDKDLKEFFDDPEERALRLMYLCDTALEESDEPAENCIGARMLYWNMLVIMHIDGEVSAAELRIFKHIAKKLKLDESITLEFDQAFKAISALDVELNSYSDSMAPYAQIRPIVDELEKRRNAILRSAMELIGDERVETVDRLTVEKDIIDITKEKVGEAMNPFMKQVGSFAGNLKKGLASTAEATLSKERKTISGLFGKMMKPKNGDSKE